MRELLIDMLATKKGIRETDIAEKQSPQAECSNNQRTAIRDDIQNKHQVEMKNELP